MHLSGGVSTASQQQKITPAFPIQHIGLATVAIGDAVVERLPSSEPDEGTSTVELTCGGGGQSDENKSKTSSDLMCEVKRKMIAS